MRMLRGIVLQTLSSPSLSEIYSFGPFNYNIQKRWKKPVDSAQTRLESRTIDFTLDKLMNHLKKLRQALGVHELMSKRRGHYTSVQLLSKWRHMSGLNTSIGSFLRKYPHIFEVYVHPVKRNLCCKTTQKMVDLITQESVVIKETEQDAVRRLKKLLMLSTNGTLHLHALWLIREELGLPDDFRNSVIPNYPDDFRVEEPDTLVLISWDSSLAEASIERWRENEYREKWLSEHETKFAFPIQFPTGYKIEKGMREKLKNWQMLPYLKPYEKKDDLRVGSATRFEKRVVSILHEFLSLLVEKRLAVERLAHFRRDLSMEVNVRELILKHPGIFYISTKGNAQTMFLREAYCKGSLVDPNPIYVVRKKMLDLVLMGSRNTGQVQQMEQLEERHNLLSNDSLINDCNDDWFLPTTEDTVEGQIIDSLDSIGEHYTEVEQE